MDFEKLVAEIAARVSEKLEAAGESCCDKPKLMILTQDHGDICHQILECPRLGERYQTVCALMEEYNCDVAEFDGIVLFGLTNEALARIATGICGTPYTKIVSQALLLGKKLWVAREQIELLEHAQVAAPAYYGMLRQQLTLLEKSGLVICGQDELSEAILREAGEEAPAQTACEKSGGCAVQPAEQATVKEVSLTSKRVITEQDVSNAKTAGATVLRVCAKAILTDLAKDYAHDRGIEIIKG